MTKSTRLAFLSALLFSAGGLTGCDIDVEVGESETSDETMGETAEPEEDTTDPEEEEEDTTEPEEDTMEPEDDEDPEEEEEEEEEEEGEDPQSCDPLLQDCPGDEGCYLLDDAYTCAPSGDGVEGEACGFGAGNCQPGLLCMPDGTCEDICDPLSLDGCGGAEECVEFDDNGLAGVCLPEGNDGEDPQDICEDPTEVSVDGQCFPICDPLLQDCNAGDTCIFGGTGGEFHCALQVDNQTQGESCEFLNSCEPGLLCIDGFLLPGSPAGDACSAVCNVSDLDSGCPAGTECQMWFEEGEVPPGYEDVGVCGIDP